jgi:sulfite reductase beta subunit-like hemoprotein
MSSFGVGRSKGILSSLYTKSRAAGAFLNLCTRGREEEGSSINSLIERAGVEELKRTCAHMQATQTRHKRKNVHRSLPAPAGVIPWGEEGGSILNHLSKTARVTERCEQKFMHMCRQLLIGYMQATQTRHERKNVHRSLPAPAGVIPWGGGRGDNFKSSQ